MRRPKGIKTRKSVAKRFKITGTGKVLRGAAFKRHILTSKTTKSKRHARGSKVVTPGDARKIKLMLPYD